MKPGARMRPVASTVSVRRHPFRASASPTKVIWVAANGDVGRDGVATTAVVDRPAADEEVMRLRSARSGKDGKKQKSGPAVQEGHRCFGSPAG